jgi:hypothetical protein
MLSQAISSSTHLSGLQIIRTKVEVVKLPVFSKFINESLQRPVHLFIGVGIRIL